MSFPIDDREDAFTFVVVLAWLRYNGARILLGGVVVALVVFPLTFYMPKTYRSAATLMVFPPTFKSDLKPDSPSSVAQMMPRALAVEDYQAIALSPAVLDEVIVKLGLGATGFESLKQRLEVELVRRGDGARQGSSVYSKTLIFHAKAESPELAARTAQAWAEVFTEHVDNVVTKGIAETSSLLGILHDNASHELDEAAQALAEHQKLWNLDLIEAQLQSKQKEYTEFEATLKQTEVKLASGEMKLKALEEELAKEPRKEVFFRAPSDDAYWIIGSERAEIGPETGLRTEQSNPVYVQTRELVVTAKEDVEGLKATREAILLKLEELKKEMDALAVTLADKSCEREKLTRDVDSLETSYKLIRAEYEKARMADRTQASDIVIVGEAVAPERPGSRGRIKTLLVAGILGMLLTGGVLALNDMMRATAPLQNAEVLRAMTARALGIPPQRSPVQSSSAVERREDSEKPV